MKTSAILEQEQAEMRDRQMLDSDMLARALDALHFRNSRRLAEKSRIQSFGNSTSRYLGTSSSAAGGRPATKAQPSSVPARAIFPVVSPNIAENALSLKQLAVAQRLLQGLTNREIADCLRLNERSVKTHLRQMFRQFGISDGDRRIKLAVMLHRNGVEAAPY